MLTNPDTLIALRLQLTALVVAILLFIASIDDDPEPPNAGAPVGVVTPYTPWPVTEQQYEMFDMPIAPQRQEDYFPSGREARHYPACWDGWDGVCA
jgi:hypothetical protein